MEKKLKFKIKLTGQEESSVAAIIAPFSVQEVFGTKARVPVKGTVNGYPFRSSLMPMCGEHMMVVMERDQAKRTVEVPTLLKKELAKSKAAKDRWETLSFSHRKEMARFLLGAKQEKTRTRRLAKVMDILKTGKKWMGH